jgi:hypothetical protein
MSSGFNRRSWKTALLGGDLAKCDALLREGAGELDLGTLHDLQAESLDLLLAHASSDQSVLEPVMGLQSIALKRSEFLGRDTDPLREENDRWRQTALRVLLARARGTQQWNFITNDLAFQLRTLSPDSITSQTALEAVERALNAHGLEDVQLDEMKEHDFRLYSFRHLPAPFLGAKRGPYRTFDAEPSPPAAEHTETYTFPGPGPGPPRDVMNRIPHIEVPDTLVGAIRDFEVRVYCDDQKAATEEDSEPITLELPKDRDEVSVDTWLSCSSHFEIIGSRNGGLRIRRGEARSLNTLEFKLKTREPPESLGGTGRITAIFSFEGAPAGRVTREISLAPRADADRSESAADTASKLVVGARVRPDLEVHITRHPDGDPWRFNCKVSGPKTLDSIAVWNLPGRVDAPTFITSSMAMFCSDKVGADQRPDLLRGVGQQLFDAAPDNFKVAYWKRIDENQPINSIGIYSEEPSIPWELMVPTRPGPGGSVEVRSPLGVEASVGRWVHPRSLPPPQELILGSSLIVAPKYKKPLTYAQTEADFVAARFDGQVVEPATYTNLKTFMAGRDVSLFHFACHGRSSQEGQWIVLANEERLFAASPRGSSEFQRAFSLGPLVFLNACEIGRPEVTLAAPQGFAPVFVGLGASGVVAAIWSVEDDVAHEVATAFYTRLCDGTNTSPASILRDLRRRSYAKSGKDSYAAYCWYGDPLLVCRLKQPAGRVTSAPTQDSNP